VLAALLPIRYSYSTPPDSISTLHRRSPISHPGSTRGQGKTAPPPFQQTPSSLPVSRHWGLFLLQRIRNTALVDCQKQSSGFKAPGIRGSGFRLSRGTAALLPHSDPVLLRRLSALLPYDFLPTPHIITFVPFLSPPSPSLGEVEENLIEPTSSPFLSPPSFLFFPFSCWLRPLFICCYLYSSSILGFRRSWSLLAISNIFVCAWEDEILEAPSCVFLDSALSKRPATTTGSLQTDIDGSQADTFCELFVCVIKGKRGGSSRQDAAPHAYQEAI
jgi:hypothetical protein